ncbi:uncharacterized protein LOC124262373 [Haliotis rubra]|uniref:uncharacterized protein LOC124262373 n=1 Tax=Haliotis rubra TaxID=36100 RepID=UPI001EE53308|nr:uncharacterized protein LOC124262373 [Haliotis rubra]
MGTRVTDRKLNDKASFYSWKQVLHPSHSLDETVVMQSNEWFQDRSECVKDAKRKFQDDSRTTKRIIIKKTRKFLCVDEVDSVNHIKHAENLLTLCYTLELSKILRRLSCDLCFGCMFDSEGELIHTCKDMLEQDQFDRLFMTAMSELHDEHVIDKWVDVFSGDPSLNHVNIVSYRCKDYRDTHFKTSDWFNELKQRVVKMLLLENRFQ